MTLDQIGLKFGYNSALVTDEAWLKMLSR